jgi:pyruvate dehydrogenase E1 component
LRADVLAGGYRLVEPDDVLAADPHAPRVVLVASGAVVPEAVHAARVLADEGVAATVVDLTSPDRVYRAWRDELGNAGRGARRARLDGLHIASLVRPDERQAPIVTVHDAASHALAWLGSVFGQRVNPVGVDAWGQSGSIVDLYRRFDLLPEQIANAALATL